MQLPLRVLLLETCSKGLVSVMSKRKCEFICPNCGVHFLRDEACSGDYHSTIYGIVLQSYCPICGEMEPLVEEMDETKISNRKKRYIFGKCAYEQKKRPQDVLDVYRKNLKFIHGKNEYLRKCAIFFQLPLERVFSFDNSNF